MQIKRKNMELDETFKEQRKLTKHNQEMLKEHTEITRIFNDMKKKKWME